MVNFERIVSILDISGIVKRLSQMEKEEMVEKLKTLSIIYPFSEYEFVISTLLGLKKMSFEEYETMKEAYLLKNAHLDKFQMAGKSVGKWAEDLMIEGGYGLQRPSKKIDPNYSQQTSYDAVMIYENHLIRIEIKAARMTESGNDEDFFVDKAIFSTDKEKSFWLNFQQLKPQYCDVFVFIAIYRDKLIHRILSSDEVKNYGSNNADHGKFSPGQHSGNSGNEGQLHIRETNIQDFDKYLIQPKDISQVIIDTYNRQTLGKIQK